MKWHKLINRIAAMVMAGFFAFVGIGGAQTSVYADSSDEESGAAVSLEADETVEIEDEDTPLGAAEDKCFIHWIILLLTLGAGGYNVMREFERINQQENEEASQEA
jgi:hypothetical protein